MHFSWQGWSEIFIPCTSLYKFEWNIFLKLATHSTFYLLNWTKHGLNSKHFLWWNLETFKQKLCSCNLHRSGRFRKRNLRESVERLREKHIAVAELSGKFISFLMRLQGKWKIETVHHVSAAWSPLTESLYTFITCIIPHTDTL